MDAGGRESVGSATITSLGTGAGVILGTAASMSPEQARGYGVDKRSDIWALGCVVQEMLTGRLAFERETISDTMAAALTRDPDWAVLPATMSARLIELLKHCVRKDPRERLRDIGDARVEPGQSSKGREAPESRPVHSTAKRRSVWPIAVAALVASDGVVYFAFRSPA